MASIIGSTLSLGGGKAGKFYQQVQLPPSSLINTPTTWTIDQSIAFPGGLTQTDCICMYWGDKVFVIGNNVIKVGDLRNKVWEETSITTGITNVATACFYDDYKIFIVENPAQAQDKVVRCISFNCNDYSVSNLTSITLFTSYTQSSYTGNGTMYYPTVPNCSLTSVYLPVNRCIYFTHIGGCCRGGFWNSRDGSSSPYKGSCGGRVNLYLCKYDIDNNTITSTTLNTVAVNSTGNWEGSSSNAIATGNNLASSWINSQNSSFITQILKGILVVDKPESILTLANPASHPSKMTTILLSNNSVSFGGIDSAINYTPTAYSLFKGNEYLTFNGTVCTIFNPIENYLSSLVVPVAPVAPIANSLGIWNNSVCFLSSTGLYMMTFISETPDNLIPIFGICKGQEFVGTKELEILNKFTITTSWQTCEEDVEICLGEYSSPGYYNLLIKNT